MPSLMTHLLAAHKYDPNASTAFCIGNIAPDSVSERYEKDRSHFRDQPDRLKVLQEFASALNLDDDFCKGVLLHLFLDYYWDIGPIRSFIENYKEGSWFPAYRHEIALASGWLFHHIGWSKSVWEEMLAYPISAYGNVHGFVKEDVADLIRRNYKWHVENNVGPSYTFTPDFIEEFTSKVATGFRRWLSNFTDSHSQEK